LPLIKYIALPLITAQEIIAAVPDEGITITQLAKALPNRIGPNPGQTPRKHFIKLVKEHLHYDQEAKLLKKRK
jgi:hypothetical protein